MLFDRDAITSETVRRLVRWGEGKPDVRAMLLTSSRAVESSRIDLFSDYDIILVVKDIHPLFADRSWLEDFGRVLALYRDPMQREFDIERFRYITQYEDGQKIDFTVWPVDLLRRVAVEPKLIDELDVGYRVLLDKDDLTRTLPLPTYRAHIPTPPTEAEYRVLIEEFFHEATYVAKHLWRCDLLPAKHSLDQVMKLEYLRKMLEWSVEIDHGWSMKLGDLGKDLKKVLKPELWKALEHTCVGPDIDENWAALFATMALFRRVAVEIGRHFGYAYPDDLDERVHAYLRKVQNLDAEAPSI